jgi:hypothetical protein
MYSAMFDNDFRIINKMELHKNPIPESRRAPLLAELHRFSNRHLNLEKLNLLAKQRFHWKNMYNDCVKTLQNC